MTTFFDEIYRRTSDLYYPHPSSWVRRTIGLAVDSRAESALDAGCGDGRHALYMAEAGLMVDAVDISATGLRKLRVVAEARGIQDNIHTCNQDITGFACEVPSYDVIVASTLLDHLCPSTIEPVATTLIRSLRPNGLIYASAFLDTDPSFTQTDLPVSDTGGAVTVFMPSKALLQLFDGLSIIDYREETISDYSHGPVHQHSIARLIGKRI